MDSRISAIYFQRLQLIKEIWFCNFPFDISDLFNCKAVNCFKFYTGHFQVIYFFRGCVFCDLAFKSHGSFHFDISQFQAYKKKDSYTVTRKEYHFQPELEIISLQY